MFYQSRNISTQYSIIMTNYEFLALKVSNKLINQVTYKN